MTSKTSDLVANAGAAADQMMTEADSQKYFLDSPMGGIPLDKILAVKSSEGARFPRVDGGKEPRQAAGNGSVEEHAIPLIVANTLVGFDVGCRLDLKSIALQARNTEYKPRQFAACLVRIKQPRATGIVYGSGKVLVTGIKMVDEANLAARKIARVLQKLGNNVGFNNFTVHNLTATADLGFRVSLERLQGSRHAVFCSYEPELFPALVYRIVRPKITVMIFHRGKLCFTGAKTVADLHTALDMMFHMLKAFAHPDDLVKADAAKLEAAAAAAAAAAAIGDRGNKAAD